MFPSSSIRIGYVQPKRRALSAICSICFFGCVRALREEGLRLVVSAIRTSRGVSSDELVNNSFEALIWVSKCRIDAPLRIDRDSAGAAAGSWDRIDQMVSQGPCRTNQFKPRAGPAGLF